MADDRFTLNIADVDESNTVPAGRYTVMVTNVRVDFASENAKNPGAPIFGYEYTIQSPETVTVTREKDGQEVTEELTVKGRKIFDNLVLTEKALWKVKNFLRAMGASKDELNSKSLVFDPDKAESYVGKVVDVQVKVDPARKNPETAEEYPERNSVSTYLKHKKTAADRRP